MKRSRRWRKFLRFVRRNKKPLLLRALFAAIPVLAVVLILRGCGAGGSGETSSSSGTTDSTVLSWETITYTNPAAAYDSTKFVKDGYFMSYEDENYVSVQGIDVSSYTGDIDWEKVQNAGIRFAFLRVGYRGYTEGGISRDAKFDENLAACEKLGIPVGIYFYSQAVSEAEAEEEAEFCLDCIQGHDIALPVIYDPEEAPSEDARTADLTKEQVTKNALAFMAVIREAGYVPGIYANREWQKTMLDMTQFEDEVIWFAGFTDTPQTSYHFEYWQYLYNGRVDGIGSDVDVDMDIRMVPKNQS